MGCITYCNKIIRWFNYYQLWWAFRQPFWGFTKNLYRFWIVTQVFLKVL